MKAKLAFMTLLASSTALARWPSMQAKWVERDYEKQVGILEYLDQGANSVIEERRLDAKEKMADFCSPKKHQIVREMSGTKEFDGRSSRGATIALHNARELIVIRIGPEEKRFRFE